VEPIVEASIGDVLKDQTRDVRLQAAADEAHQICVALLKLEGDLINKLPAALLLVVLVSIYDRALNSNSLVVVGDYSVEDLAKVAFPNELAVVVGHFLQLHFREGLNVHVLQYFASVFVEEASPCTTLLLLAKDI
jgi:hypothetical protein